MISIVQSEETSDKRQGSGVQLTSLAFQLYILDPVVELWDSVPLAHQNAPHRAVTPSTEGTTFSRSRGSEDPR